MVLHFAAVKQVSWLVTVVSEKKRCLKGRAVCWDCFFKSFLLKCYAFGIVARGYLLQEIFMYFLCKSSDIIIYRYNNNVEIMI